MSETADMITDATRRIFQDLGEPQEIIRRGDDAGWRPLLWSAVEEAGLSRAWLPEALGGAGLSAPDTFAVLRVAGMHAAAIPLAETLLAARLLGGAAIAPPDGPLTVAPVLPQDRLDIDAQGRISGRARAVPFARLADHFAVLADGPNGGTVALVAREACTIEPADSIADDPADTVTFEAAPALERATATLGREDLRSLGAAMRAMQIAGAMQALLDMTTDYARERVAFGRPIGNFQAVQHLLARLAEETATAVAAAGSVAHALETLPPGDSGLFFEVAAAKVRAGEAAGEAAMIAHQVHGAIGFTAEHPLHRFTQRLWAWRDDFGAEAEWARGLGQRVAAGGAAAFWPTVTAI
ncbi:MAG TPA: acyl-CoA dehydrogenase family protein [Alphaproteobacteria bacterium]|nr:acyl-CoA dehydrogenase family protein [Alphaproteobacteria bacterium]